MSFVTGFATGVGTGEAYELRKVRRLLREYLQRRGITMKDGQGRDVSIDTLLVEGLPTPVATWLLIAAVGIGVFLVAGLGLSLFLLL